MSRIGTAATPTSQWGLACPKCGIITKVINSRDVYLGTMRVRRRECLSCGHRFTTSETYTGDRHDLKAYPNRRVKPAPDLAEQHRQRWEREHPRLEPLP